MSQAWGPLIFAVALAFVSGCTSGLKPSTYLAHRGIDHSPTIGDFEVCSASGCSKTTQMGYTEDEWAAIESVFHPPSESAKQERKRITRALGIMETIIGQKNNTLGDAPQNKRRLGTGNQIDCIAETANTTVALMLLDQEGHLRFHYIGYPRHRGFTRLQMPHIAASIIEKETDAHYIVDSWFFAGGEPAISVPLKEWKAGYNPNSDTDISQGSEIGPEHY